MIFKQYKDGSCDIIFSWKERLLLLRKGKLHLNDESLRHFSNTLIKIITEWNINFNEDLKNRQTFDSSKIEGK
jgi:hypothetical protein